MPPDENAETPSVEQYWVAKCLEYRSSILRIKCGESIGTGWIAAHSADGDAFLVATAEHVVQSHSSGPQIDELVLCTADSPESEIIVKYGDNNVIVKESWDVAVIRVNAPPPGPELPLLVDERAAQRKGRLTIKIPPLGTDVGWIGFAETPYRIFGKPTITFCRGRISAVGQNCLGHHVFLLDGNVNRGMSGGPVWDSYGNIMGLVSGIVEPEVGTLHGVIVPIGYVWSGLSKAGACSPQAAIGSGVAARETRGVESSE